MTSNKSTNNDYFKNLFEQNNYNLDSCTDELMKRYANVTYSSFAGVKGAKTKDGSSTQMRNLGNTYYQTRKFLEALRFYNHSISAAEPDTLELAQAYSNRAKVFYVKKYYKECLQDIERAQAISVYPEESKNGLVDLKNKTLDKLKRGKTIQYHLPPPPIDNPTTSNPAVAECLEGQENVQWGRHVIATRDIKPGEVLLAEEPYAQNVYHEMTWSHCTECMELCFNMIPCDNCFVVMFCSEDCKEKGYATYHKYECQLVQEDVTIPQYLFIRMTLKCVAEKAISESNTFSDEFNKIKEIRLFDDHNQNNKKTKKLISDICDWLISKTDIAKNIKLDKITATELLKTLMYKNYLVCLNNVARVLKYDPKTLAFIKVGEGFYEFFSKINHSCIGNVSYSFFGRKLVVRAMGTIKKGEQCFVNYERMTPYKLELKYRKEILQNYFSFTCKCKACMEDWPLGSTLKSIKTDNKDLEECTTKVLVALKLITDSKDASNDTLEKILGGGEGQNVDFPVRDESGNFHPALRQIILEDAFEAAEKLKEFQPCQEFYFLDHVFDQLLLRGNFEVEF